jgi:ABC-type transport system involved in multi-copper enzyme maturation permease subunit
VKRLIRIGIVAKLTLLESLRRKDLYVLLILSMVIVGGAGCIRFFGIEGIQRFLKDVALLVTNICLTVIVVTATARQFPHELESRTLYPLLAKPLTRLEFIVGKFLGCWAMGAFTLALFSLEFLVALRLLYVALVVAMTLFLSLFLTHAANVTFTLLLCLGASIFSRSINLIHAELGWLGQKVVLALYYVIPHVDLFDMSKKVVHDWEPIPATYLAILTVYAVVYVVLFLGGAQLRFGRRTL